MASAASQASAGWYQRAKSLLSRLVRAEGPLVGLGSPASRRVPGLSPPLLALHGFGGTPRDVDLLLEVATAQRRAASAPLLPGHGSRVEALSASGWAAWACAAERELEDLCAEHTAPAVVAGLSLGSLLALHLAHVRPARVAALVLLAPPIRLHAPWPEWPLALLSALKVSGWATPKRGPDILSEASRDTYLGFKRNPIGAASEVRRAGRKAMGTLASIHCPTLVLQGQHDRVCHPSSGREVLRCLAATDKSLVILGRSAHILTRDHDAPLVYTYVRDFITRVAPCEANGTRPLGVS